MGKQFKLSDVLAIYTGIMLVEGGVSGYMKS